jgi:hypothetical protein
VLKADGEAPHDIVASFLQAQQVRTDLEQRITALEAIVAQQAAAAAAGSGSTPVEAEAVLMAVDTPQE